MVHVLHTLCREGVHNTEQAGCAGAGTSVPSSRSELGVSVLNFRWKKQTTESPSIPRKGIWPSKAKDLNRKSLRDDRINKIDKMVKKTFKMHSVNRVNPVSPVLILGG